jgi:hypothetical protein
VSIVLLFFWPKFTTSQLHVLRDQPEMSMNPENFKNEQKRKGRRVVTACSECYRRKQKCDRKIPCSVCISRKVANKCTYGCHEQRAKNDEIRTLLPHPETFTTRTVIDEEAESSQNVHEPSLTGQVGYSQHQGDHAFKSLQKSFRIPDELIKLHDPVERDAANASKDPSFTSRYRNLVALLPAMNIARGLSNIYFAEVSWYSSTIDRYYFEEDYVAWLQSFDGACIQELSRNLQFFPALLFQVLAVALQFLPTGTLTGKLLQVEESAARERLSHRYSTAGVEIMSLMKRHNPALNSIQADQIRALWLKCCSRGTESWYSITDGIRQAQDIGLHIQSEVPQGQDVGETLSRLWFDEHKRRIWTALFIGDSHMSIILGRPRAINTSDCTVRTPFDTDLPSEPSKTIPGTANPAGPPSHFSLSLFNYALGHLFHEMLSLGLGKKHTKNYDKVDVLHRRVLTLLSDLPPAVRPSHPDTSWDLRDPDIARQRWQITTVANSFLISLHREHVQVHTESRNAALNAALDLLSAQESMFKLIQPHHYRMYGLSCHSIDACMFLTATILDVETIAGLDPAYLLLAENALRKAIARLHKMAPMSPMAKSGADLLDSCFEKVGEVISGMMGLPDEHDSSHTLSVNYQDHLGEQQAKQGINVNAQSDVAPHHTSLDDFGGDRFRPDMFEDLVTLDMGQDGFADFDFDPMDSWTLM